MTAPATEVRGILIGALNTEFAAEGIVFAHDKMHPAMAMDAPKGAVYPDQEVTRPGRQIEMVTSVFIQVYAKWEPKVDPEQAVDPSLVEGWAERLRQAIKVVQTPATATTWFFTVTSVDYMDDPTGNRSRFIARVEAHGSNSNLVETGP